MAGTPSKKDKIDVFEQHFGKKKQITFALIKAAGIKPNAWSTELLNHVISLEDLLKF